MNIPRVTVKHTNQFIRLRDDYGSLWNGTVNVQDCGIIPDNNDPVYLVSAKVIYDNDGFVCCNLVFFDECFFRIGYNLCLQTN